MNDAVAARVMEWTKGGAWRVSAITLVVVVAASSDAAAREPERDPFYGVEAPPRGPSPLANAPAYAWEDRPIVVEGQLGVGAPLGLLGLSIDYAPIPLLELAAGVGLGAGGPQGALSAHLRFLRWGHKRGYAIYVGWGGSLGPYDARTPLVDLPIDGSSYEPGPYHHFDVAYWSNLEAGIEIRSRSGFLLRPFVGVGLLLDPNDGTAVLGAQGARPAAVSPWLPYVGLGLGYAFDMP